MLVAIQRGFAATLCWSPLGFSMALSTKLVAGANWNHVVLPCLGSAALLLLGGWALDTIFKPRLANPPPPRAPETGSWLVHLRPLLLLLAVVGTGVAILHALTGVEVVGAVILVLATANTLVVTRDRAGEDVAAAVGQSRDGHELVGDHAADHDEAVHGRVR